MKANEFSSALMDVETQYQHRQEFLRNFAELLSQTDLMVKSITVDRNDRITVITADGCAKYDIPGGYAPYIDVMTKILDGLREIRELKEREKKHGKND